MESQNQPSNKSSELTVSFFIKPLDVLYLRGNKLFGEAGSHGIALMPPWPSLVAGAIRSWILAEAGIDTTAYAKNKDQRLPTMPDDLHELLGTPNKPGTFHIKYFTVAKQFDDESLHTYFPLPNDVVVIKEQANILQPTTLLPTLRCSHPLTQLPLLRAAQAGKPQPGLWLTQAGWQAYLNGQALNDKTHLIDRKELWQSDYRLGIALNPHSRTASEGKIYTTETVALNEGCGFLATVQNNDNSLPKRGFLRLGGDGRAAQIHRCNVNFPQPDWSLIDKNKKFRLLLTTPGLFRKGWLLPKLEQSDNRWIWRGNGFQAHLVSASVSRSEIISGWNLAKWQPKTALRAASVGSVYWFDEFEGAIESLANLVNEGLWALDDYPDPQRRAEGFNQVAVAAWLSQ